MKWTSLLLVFLVQGLAVSQAGNGTVAGRLLMADGNPASGMTVVATPATSPSAVYFSHSAQTDSSGNYKIDNVPPGDYFVVFFTPGFPITHYPGARTSEKASAVKVRGGENVVGIDFKVVAEGNVAPPHPVPVP